jgi:L-amino acid N-acyltransferase YncA
MFKKLGFEKIGTMKEVGCKFGRRLDVHLMQIVF